MYEKKKSRHHTACGIFLSIILIDTLPVHLILDQIMLKSSCLLIDLKSYYKDTSITLEEALFSKLLLRLPPLIPAYRGKEYGTHDSYRFTMWATRKL